MRKAIESDLKTILPYLREHVSDCLYMYIDIAKYGLDHPDMDVWVSEYEGTLNTVVMKYHTGISFYTNQDNWDQEGVVKLILSEKPNSITARKDLIDSIYPSFNEDYITEFGYVFEFTRFQDMEITAQVERAKDEDLLEIAQLVTSDQEVGSYFEIEDLARQYKERIDTNMGRNYFIRENGKIVAHIASYAEYDGIATTSGLIVAPSCRQSLYGAFLEKYLLEDLMGDGFDVYTYITNRLRYRLLKAMGNKCVGEYGKMMIKDN